MVFTGVPGASGYESWVPQVMHLDLKSDTKEEEKPRKKPVLIS